jgi:hypothetical protein
MAVVALGSVRSCGVTTAVAALAAVWPEERRRVVVELDPAGGTLAAVSGLRVTPGLVSLATASRRRMEPDAVVAHSQQLPAGGAVVVGPPSAAQARRALQLLLDAGANFGDVDADVLVDCGRLDPTSPARAVFETADVQLVLARPQLPNLHHLAGWFDEVRSNVATPNGLPAVVLAGAGPYAPAEIRGALGVDVTAHIPYDPGSVGRLAEPPTGRTTRRSPLLRAASSLAAALVEQLPPQADTCAETQPRPDVTDAATRDVDNPVGQPLVSEEARS